MITEIKEYWVTDIPTDKDLEEGLSYSKINKCIIKLTWFIPYNGYNYLFIHYDEDLETIKDRIPNSYPI